MKKEHDIRIDRTKLHPWLDYRMGILLKKCAKKGIYLIITEGFRSKEYQDLLYAKGSTYSSQHMWGIAFDIAINDSKLLYDTATIKKVAVIAKKIGLGWGGDWTSIVDTPHFYLTKWGSTTSQLKSLYATPDVFKKTWKKKVKREKGLLLWKAKSKLTGSYLRIPNGATVEVLYTKGWYTKVRYKGKVGYVNKKFVE